MSYFEHIKPQAPALHDQYDAVILDGKEVEQASEDDLWFLPGTMEAEPDYLPPGPRAEPRETEVLDDWRKAEAGHAARLARVASRLGALDDRLKRGPEGWRHRLALIEAADLSWFAGDRIGADGTVALFGLVGEIRRFGGASCRANRHSNTIASHET